MRQLAFDSIEPAAEFGFKASTYRELAIQGSTRSNTTNVLPLLSRLSHHLDERWLTCINSPLLAKDVAIAADILPRKLLQVKSSATMGTAEIIKKAIRAGHSHTVIGFCDDLTLSQREELKQCAERADCQCLVLTGG
jgi:cell division inhibitor SulA